MFVVGPMSRVLEQKPNEADKFWPVIFEDVSTGRNSGVIAKKDSREAAQSLADALNKALNAAP